MRLIYLGFVFTVVNTFAQPPDTLAVKSRLAKQALLDGRYQEAASLYRELLKGVPDNSGLRLNLALALEKAGQPSAAIPEAQRVTRADPSSAPAWFLLGLGYQQLYQPAKAIVPLREAVRLDPANHSALLELADAELTTGDARAAVSDFGILAKAEPRLPKAWEGLGRSYLSVSESAFRQLEKLAPESPYFLALLARSRTAESSESMAERELHVPSPDCLRQHAACAGVAGDWPLALAAARGSVLPENLYWTCLAASHLAEKSFNQLASLPASSEIHAVLASSYQRLGRRVDAIAEWRKALELAPQDRLFQARLAESLILARVYPEAEGLLNSLVAQEPENGEWQYLLGNLLQQLKRDDEALPHLIAATKRLPDLLPAQEALGRVYLDLSKPAEAIVHLEKARSLDDGSISFALSSAYRQLGRQNEADAALARYQAIMKQRSSAASK